MQTQCSANKLIFLFEAVEIYTIQVLIQPGKAVGGEVFKTQPQVAVYDSNGILAVDLGGYAYAEMSTSPTGEEPLWIGTCDLSSCGSEVTNSNSAAFATFDNGVGTFEVCVCCACCCYYSLMYVFS